MFKHILTCIILLNVCLSADDSKKNSTENPQNSVERGFAYKNEKQVPEEKKGKDKQDIIIDLLKKQLIVQEEIRDLLKEEYDPAPRLIKNSKGEECIANSSADCFEMPIVAEARRIPVIKNWMKNGDLQSSVKFLQWQAEYFKQVTKRAYNNVAAVNQFGTEAYPVNYNTMGYNNVTGYASTTMKNQLEKNVLEKYLGKINFIWFIGENFDADLYSMDNIAKFLSQYGNKIKLQFIFKDSKSMNAFKIAEQHNSEFGILNKYKMSVNPKEFANFNIHNSPSLVAINKEKKTAQTVMVGRATKERTNRMIIMYLRNQEILKDEELNKNNAWKDNSSYGVNHVEKILGKDYLNKIMGGTR